MTSSSWYTLNIKLSFLKIILIRDLSDLLLEQKIENVYWYKEEEEEFETWGKSLREKKKLNKINLRLSVEK